MQPAVENGSINDLRPVDAKNRTRTVTSQDKTAWHKQIREQVGPWPDDVWIREAENEALERDGTGESPALQRNAETR